MFANLHYWVGAVDRVVAQIVIRTIQIILYAMINSLESTAKMKIRTVYHNYNLSTKNFDGNMLYELFLASAHLHKTDINFPKPETRPDSKHDGRRSARSATREDTTKPVQLQRIEERSSKILKLITSEYEKRRQSTQFMNCKSNSQQARQQYSISKGEQESDRMCMSMEAGKPKTMIQRELLLNRNIQPSSKLKRPIPKKKQKLNLQDFVQAEHIAADLWMEGRLGGFSAQSITVISNNKIVYSYEGNKTREIASLTKIMTCITALYLAKKYELDPKRQQVKVSNRASMQIGTTAGLMTGDVLTLNDLFHAMMLPSGNDAAQAISEFFDKFISEKSKQQAKDQVEGRSIVKNKIFEVKINNAQSTTTFLTQMNKLASHLNMKNTHFENAHGLSNQNNYSTANDMVELCHYAMKNPDFREIVKCQQFETQIFSSRQKMKRNVKWMNTNKLLSLNDCQGIKTGITPTAGPCMAASFRKQGFSVVIVILNAKNKIKRFQQVKNLYEWAQSQRNLDN